MKIKSGVHKLWGYAWAAITSSTGANGITCTEFDLWNSWSAAMRSATRHRESAIRLEKKRMARESALREFELSYHEEGAA